MFVSRTLRYERQPVRKHVIALIAIALVLFVPALLLPEYRASDEAIYSQLARDIVENGNWLSPRLHGGEFHCFPMYPWLVAICSGLQAPTPFTTRLPALLALGCLSLACAAFARRYMGNQSAMVAACVVLFSFVGMHAGIIGQSAVLETLFLTCAWFSWYNFGRRQERWHLAWGIAFLFVFLGVLTAGADAIVKFYLPLLFLRSKVRIFSHFKTTQHYVNLLAFAALVTIWTRFVCPYQPFLPWNDAIAMGNPAVSVGFFHHLWYLPVACVSYLMPWGVLFWTPFCLAFRQFEPEGTMCSYLRTIVLSIFLIDLVIPTKTPLMLLPVLGAMAVLIGIHFRVPASRYRTFFSRLTKSLGMLGGVAFAFGTIFWALVAVGIIMVEQVDAHSWLKLTPAAWCLSAICLGCLLLVYTQVLYRSSEGRVAMTLVWSAAGLRFAYLCLVLPIVFFTVEDRRLVALALSNRLSTDVETTSEFVPNADTVVYYRKNTLNIVSLAHLGCPLIAVDRPSDDLPKDEKIVYVISSEKPAVPERQWVPVTPFININQARKPDWHSPVDWWKALRAMKFSRAVFDVGADGSTANVRAAPYAIYRGRLREE